MPIEDALALRQSRSATLQQSLAPLLARSRRLTLEVGSGHGHFLTSYAEAHPDELCIGIDLLEDRLERASRKSQRAGLPNIAWLHAEAGLFLDVLPKDVVLAHIFILFPDPWPKRRHHKNRLLQPSFLTKIARHVAPASRLYFRTDHSAYFASARAAVEAHDDWDIDGASPWPFELATVFQQRAATYHSLIARPAGAELHFTVSAPSFGSLR